MLEPENISHSSEISYLVGIGASAGGLEALQDFFQHLPGDTRMAFVVIQHLSPDYKSVMDELLQKHTTMPVNVVESDTEIEPNHVYLISSRSNLIIQNNRLVVLKKDPQQRLNLPIDLFFHSLGEAYHERAVGIVLSGTGTDGSRGAKTIKENEGLVMVQTPEEARFDGMPNAIVSQSIADFVLSSRELALELARLAYHAPWLSDPVALTDQQSPGNIEPQLLKRILVEVKKQSKIDFSLYREQTISRRLLKRIRVLNLFSLDEYFQYMMAHPEEPRRLTREFLIGVTRFFRDGEAWELLKERVLPEICANREPDQTLRLWVTCCSTGEEAYSLAILVHEYLSEQNLSLDFKVFATDVDEEAIVFAGQGRYPESVFASISSERLSRYFEKVGESYVIKKLIRDHIVFARHNLLTDPPFLKQDLISCRNMLVYIQAEHQRKILSTLHFSLRLNGFLFLGKSESLGDLGPLFKNVNLHLNIFQNIQEAKAHQLLLDNHYLSERSEFRPQAEIAETQAKLPALDKRFYENTLLGEYVPTILFVSRDGEVLYAHGNVHPYIMFPRGRVRYDLKSMLNEQELTLIQSGMLRSLSNRQTIVYSNVPLERGHESLKAAISIRPIWHAELKQDVFLLEFKPAEPLVQDGTVVYVDGAELVNEQLTALRLELHDRSRENQTLREKLETSNEELQASNEELLAANEELQSTNEELHSVNEELYTVNSELEAKLKSLAELNNDLSNFLNSSQIGLIFLDLSLNIRRFTPSIRQVFNLYDSDVGRSISHFSTRFDQAFDLERVTRQVLLDSKVYEQEVSVGGEQEFIVRVLPYITLEGRVEGVVMSLVNITELNQARRRALLLDERYQTIFNNIPDYIVLTDKQGRVKLLNQRFSSEQTRSGLGHNVSALFGGEPDDYTRAIHEVDSTGNAITITTKLIRDGRTSSFSHRICPLPSLQGTDGEPEIILVTRDITELSEYQQRLQDEAVKLQGLIDSSSDLIAALGTDYRLLVANKAFQAFLQQWFGCEYLDELSQSNLFEWLPRETSTQRLLYDRLSEVWQRALGGQTYQIEEIIELPDGSAPIYQLRVSRLMAADSQHLGAVMVMRDVTAERKAERSLHVAVDELKRTNAYLDSFVYAAAHDLRTPIANLISIIERMQKRPQVAAEPMFELLERSVHNLDQTLGGLIEIIDVQKMSDQAARPVSFKKLIEKILLNYPLLQNGELGSLELNLEVDEINYIEAYLNSIVQNLVDNAVKYREPSRKLSVCIKTSCSSDGMIHLTVRDNGLGIPSKLAKDKLFRAFKRYHKQVEGKGIGLYLVKTLVEKNGGWVDVEAQPEGGTAFLLGLKEYVKTNKHAK